MIAPHVNLRDVLSADADGEWLRAKLLRRHDLGNCGVVTLDGPGDALVGNLVQNLSGISGEVSCADGLHCFASVFCVLIRIACNFRIFKRIGTTCGSDHSHGEVL